MSAQAARKSAEEDLTPRKAGVEVISSIQGKSSCKGSDPSLNSWHRLAQSYEKSSPCKSRVPYVAGPAGCAGLAVLPAQDVQTPGDRVEGACVSKSEDECWGFCQGKVIQS